MFRVQDTILSEEIATARFACDLTRCKGSCCVVGDAGAPVDEKEIPALNKAYRFLKDELNSEAKETVEQEGLIQEDEQSGYRLSCIDSGECVFVKYDEQGVAKCAIQEAFDEGRFDWEKPMSCHLFPIRLKQVEGFEYANFEYLPNICSAGCARGKKDGIWLSDFLREPLIRRYGKEWYTDFKQACREVRVNQETVDVC